MPLYESVYIARPDISATQVEALTADWTKILEDNGGKVTKDEYWGLKSLAYRIKKNRKGHYSLMNIDAPPAALAAPLPPGSRARSTRILPHFDRAKMSNHYYHTKRCASYSACATFPCADLPGFVWRGGVPARSTAASTSPRSRYALDSASRMPTSRR